MTDIQEDSTNIDTFNVEKSGNKHLGASFLTRTTEDTLITNLAGNYTKVLDEEEDHSFTFSETLKFAPGYYFKSIPLIFNRICPLALNMVSMYYISFFEDPALTAGFGMGHSLFMFFFMMFTLTSCEAAGIWTSKAFGAGDYKTMRLQFYRGIGFNFLILFFSIAMYVKMDAILIGIGLEEEMSRNAHMMIMSMIPAICVQSLNEMAKNLLVAQGIYKPFIWINLIIFAFFPVGGYFLIWKSGWGIAGFGIFKFIVEAINFIGIAILFKYKAHPESLVKEPLSVIFGTGFGSYTCNFFKILLGWYADYLGFECNTILLGLLQDNDIMSAWVSFMNVSGIVYVIGSGMAMCMRTITALKIGQNKMLEAKKLGKMCWILTLCYSITVGVTLMCIPEKVSTIYTNLESVKVTLVPMIFYGGITAIMLGMGACVATLLRVIGKSCFLSVLMGVDQVLIFDGFSAWFLYGLGLPAYSVIFGFMIGYTISIVVGSSMVFWFNWEKIPRVDK
jgi:Na+-driven multidrug efflux pump